MAPRGSNNSLPRFKFSVTFRRFYFPWRVGLMSSCRGTNSNPQSKNEVAEGYQKRPAFFWWRHLEMKQMPRSLYNCYSAWPLLSGSISTMWDVFSLFFSSTKTPLITTVYMLPDYNPGWSSIYHLSFTSWKMFCLYFYHRLHSLRGWKHHSSCWRSKANKEFCTAWVKQNQRDKNKNLWKWF